MVIKRNSENGNFISVTKKNALEKLKSQESKSFPVIIDASQCQRKRNFVTESSSSESPKRSKVCHPLPNSHHFEALSDDLLIQVNKKGQISLVHLLIQTGFLQPNGPGEYVGEK
jgi:hypothetical protein